MRRVLLPAIAVVLCLSGCAEQAPREETSQSSTPSSSDEKRARSVWDAYLKTYSDLSSSPERAISALEPYVTDAEYQAVSAQVADLRKKQVVLQGSITSRGFKVVSPASSSEVVALVCVENNNSRYIAKDGSDVTPKDRVARFTLRLEFVVESATLRLDRDVLWEKSSVC